MANRAKIIEREQLRKINGKKMTPRSRWRRHVRRNNTKPVIVDRATDLAVRRDLARRGQDNNQR